MSVFEASRKMTGREQTAYDLGYHEGQNAAIVHGRWTSYSTTMMECSVCKRHTARHRFEYCPHCGAKMDGGVIDG